jgi:hypothetical protein
MCSLTASILYAITLTSAETYPLLLSSPFILSQNGNHHSNDTATLMTTWQTPVLSFLLSRA